MRKGIFMLLVPVFACILVVSCKPQVPSEYLQPGEMEDILYDYHLAMGMTADDSSNLRRRMYEEAILRKYGVSHAEFDSSLVYYTRHADRFKEIYENVSKRLSDEAVVLGASASEISSLGGDAASGDTTNVWKNAVSCVLATQVPYNVESFCLKADSAYHKGDRLMLSFDTQFIFQDGYKDGVAMLAVRFGNDSVAARTIHMSESSHYSIAVGDDNGLGIKEIRGFFCLQNSPNSSATTLKLMFINNIRLVRCHVRQSAAERKAVPAAGQPSVVDDSVLSQPSAVMERKMTSGASGL